MEEIQITQKSDREHVLLRPGMYIPNKNYLITELADNVMDEHAEGYGNKMYIALTDEKIMVKDWGRGLPVTPCNDDPEVSGAERAMSSLRAGGKFGDEGNYTSKTGGLNGVGAAVVNFLSDEFTVIVKKLDKTYSMTFEKGIITNKLGEFSGNDSTYEDNETGTLIIQRVNDEVWEGKEDFNIPSLTHRLQSMAFLNAGFEIGFDIDYKGITQKYDFKYDDGIVDYVNHISKGDDLTDVFHSTYNSPEIDIDFAFKYTESTINSQDNVLVFTNNIENIDGGSHLTGLKEGLFQAIKEYYKENNTAKNEVQIESDDCREGFFGVLSVKVNAPDFSGQGKEKLVMNSVRASVRTFVHDYILEVMDKNPNIAKQIVNKVLDAVRARESARKAREANKKSKALSSGSVKGLTKCNSNNPAECELFLVEGDSAGGSAKQARDNNIQAIIPIFGKINNTEEKSLAEVLKFDKLMEAVKALGCGIGKEFNIDNLRYNKIILMSDGDVDGFHIQTLWVTFFYLHMRQLIDEGHVYISCPPLYSVEIGKTKEYFYSDATKNAYVEANKGKKMNINRFKGLGEMKAQELWDSTMDPKRRTLIQVTAEDAGSALDMIAICMGKDTTRRREFIMQNDPESISLF